MKRDVQEGQARCLAHLGRHEEALEIAANLVSGSIACSHAFLYQGHQSRFLSEKQTCAGSRLGRLGLQKETVSSVIIAMKLGALEVIIFLEYFPVLI